MPGRHALVAVMLAICATAADAQSYPVKPIKVIVPYTPGSPVDVLARVVTQQVAARLAQGIVIDNRPGAGTTLGTKMAASAEPDGYTLLIGATSFILSFSLYQNLDYDARSFVPVAMLAHSPQVLVIAPSVPAATVAEFVAYAKANPGKLNFGFGLGTLPQILGESFKIVTGTEIASIPYKGGAQAVTDMLGGRIDMNFGATVTLAPLAREGKLRALAVTGPDRSRDLPDVPTMTESGLPNVTTVTYYGLMGPPGLAPDVVGRINSEVNEILKSPELVASMEKLGFGTKGGSPQDFTALLREQNAKWTPIVKTVGFQME